MCEFSGYVPEKIRFLTHTTRRDLIASPPGSHGHCLRDFSSRDSQPETGSQQKKILIVGWDGMGILHTWSQKIGNPSLCPGETTNPGARIHVSKRSFFPSRPCQESEEDLLVWRLLFDCEAFEEYNSKWKREKKKRILAGPGKARFVLCVLLFLFWDVGWEDAEGATCALEMIFVLVRHGFFGNTLGKQGFGMEPLVERRSGRGKMSVGFAVRWQWFEARWRTKGDFERMVLWIWLLKYYLEPKNNTYNK